MMKSGSMQLWSAHTTNTYLIWQLFPFPTKLTIDPTWTKWCVFVPLVFFQETMTLKMEEQLLKSILIAQDECEGLQEILTDTSTMMRVGIPCPSDLRIAWGRRVVNIFVQWKSLEVLKELQPNQSILWRDTSKNDCLGNWTRLLSLWKKWIAK